MKLAPFDLPISSKLLLSGGRRLDGNPYLTDAVQARLTLDRLPPSQLVPLKELTLGGLAGIYHAGREGRRYVENPEYGVPFLRSTDILAADLSNVPFLSKAQVARNPLFRIREGMTLITRSGTIGRMAYCRPDMDGLACSEDVLRVVPNPARVLPGYLYAFLSSRFGKALVTGGTYGAIIQHIEPNHIADIGVPRLDEEVEREAHELIVEAGKLRAEALRAIYKSGNDVLEVNGLKKLTENNILQTPLLSYINSSELSGRLDAKFHSYLAIEAETELTKCDNPILEMGNSEVSSRLFKPPIFKRLWVDSSQYGPPFVSGNDVYRMYPSPERYISPRTPYFNEFILQFGTVIFQAAGQLNGIFGWPLLVNSYIEGMFCADDVFRIQPNNAEDGGYIYAYLRTEYGQRLIKRQAYGYSIPRVVAQHVSKVLLPWPQEHIRHSIGRKVVDAWELISAAATRESQAVTLVEEAVRALAR